DHHAAAVGPEPTRQGPAVRPGRWLQWIRHQPVQPARAVRLAGCALPVLTAAVEPSQCSALQECADQRSAPTETNGLHPPRSTVRTHRDQRSAPTETDGPHPPKTPTHRSRRESTAQVQELQVPFVLADDVVDDL